MNTTTKLKLDKWMLGTIALALIMVVCLQPDRTDAQSRSNRQPEAIVCVLKTTLGPPVTNQFGIVRDPIGLEVAYISASNPQLNALIGQPAGPVIALLIADGYQLHWLSADKVVGIK